MKKTYQPPDTLIITLTGAASLLSGSSIGVIKGYEIGENFSRRHRSVWDDEYEW